MSDCSHLGCIQHYNLLVGTDCILAGRIEDSHIGHPAVVGSSFGNQLALLHIVQIVADLV